jgi:hypothetical protein
LVGGLSVFGSIFYAGWGAFDRLREQSMREAQTLIASDSASQDQVAKIVRTILQYMIENPLDNYKGYAIGAGLISIIICLVFGVVLASFAESSKPSFVVLTSRADEARKIELDRDQNNWSSFIVSICGALIISVLGNYLFFLVLKHYLKE